jgi:galactokinase
MKSDELLQGFARAFGAARPTHRVRAPGRVNLIGEHVDYNDLPVLPMALQLATHVLAAPREDATVRIANAQERYGPREFALAPTLEPSPAGDWVNYAKAAAQLLAREYGATRGADLFVASDLPPAAGLASSSALVVTFALALCATNGLAPDPLGFAERLAAAERFVGTHSGGMDQAIALAARAGHACRIEFAPLRVEALPVPASWRFVVAHSTVEAHKAAQAREHYNARRADCEKALAQLVASPELRAAPRSYRGLLEHFGAERLAWIAERNLSGQLLARARHQFSEFARVSRARRCLIAADLAGFGALLDESHASLRDDFDVSCAQLDALVEAARASGAVGARLTGAGFGGCIVALAQASDTERLLDGLRERFYARLPSREREFMLVAEPGAGAQVSVA